MAFDLANERGPAYSAGALALLMTIATIAVALAFEYIGGYAPCPLCLMQRYAYYIAIPALFLALALHTAGYRSAAGAIFLLSALAFVGNGILGVYHAGAEWSFWPGPDSCAGGAGVTATAGNLLQELQTTTVIRCDEASFRFLGLSFAGWNVIASGVLAALCLRAASAEMPKQLET